MPFKISPKVRKNILERLFNTTPERRALLAENIDRIEDLAQHENTRRMYLMGSGASSKPNPNDIDLLVRAKDFSKAEYNKFDTLHEIPISKLAQPKQNFDELVSDMMIDQGISKEQATRQAKAFIKYTDTGRDFMKVGRNRYGKDYKWVRLAGAGGAAAATGEWLTSEDAEAAPPEPNVSDWITSEVKPPTPTSMVRPKANFMDDLVAKVKHVESRGNPYAISKKGAAGLMQLMPGTAKQYGVTDVFDPKQNEEGGRAYLKDLLYKYGGDQKKALAAYNWGPTRLDKLLKSNPTDWVNKLPSETKAYVSKVMGATPSLVSTRTRIPQEGGWLTQELDAVPPPTALPPSALSAPAAPPVKLEGQHPVISAEEIDKLNEQYGSGEQAPMGRVMGAEDPKLDFLQSLGLGTAVTIPASLMVKAAGKSPATAAGVLLTAAIAAPLYVFSEGILTKRPTAESAKELPGELFWWAAGGALPPVIARGVKSGAKAIMPGVDRMMHGPLQKVVKPLEPLGDAVWNTIIKPTQIQIPGIKKSVAEMFQPAVERMANNPKLSNTAKTFRNAEIQKSHTNYLGQQMSKELNRLTPSQRYDVSRGLRGEDYGNLDPIARDVLNRFDKGLQDVHLTTRYENAFKEEWGKGLQKVFGGIESDVSESSIKRITTLFDNPLAGKQKVRIRDIHNALDDVIADPRASGQVKAFARDLYNLPADTSEMVYQSSNKASMQLLQQKLINTPGIVSDHLKPGYIMTNVGKMKGMYVPRDVDLELKALVEIPKISRGFYQKWFLSPWKTSKVILRPATHIRNMISNTILNDWGGLPFWRADVYVDALKQMSKRSDVWKEFSQRTGHYANFTVSDVGNLSEGMRHGAGLFDKLHHTYSRIVEPAGSLYNAEETMFKFAKYLHNRELGLSKSEAAFDAMKWTFNYAETTPEVAKIGKYAIPFVRWYSKAIPLMAETAVKHPLRFSKWLAFGAGLQQHALNQTGTSEEEWTSISQQLPDYIKNGIYLPMPWRDDQGRLNLMNLTYILPGIGDVNELYQRSLPELALQNPVLTTSATLISKKKYGGAPLYYEWEEPSVKAAKALSYVWESFVPAVVPGGTDWNSLYRAITEGPEGTGPSTEEAMAGWFGFKLTPVDPEANARRSEAVKKIYESEMANMMQKELRKASSGEEAEAILERFQRIRERQEVGD